MIVTPLAGVASADGPNCDGHRHRAPLGAQSGPSAPVMRTGASRPRAGRRARDQTVDLRSFTVAAGHPRGIDEHGDLRADQVIPSGGGDVVLQGSELTQAFIHQPPRHGSVERVGVGALLGRVGEEPAPVELRGVHEAEQLVVIGFGLPRVPHDEVRPEGSLRRYIADRLDATEELLAVAPTPHPAHQRARHVLQREVEVRHTRAEDRVDERLGRAPTGRGTTVGPGRPVRPPRPNSGTRLRSPTP